MIYIFLGGWIDTLPSPTLSILAKKATIPVGVKKGWWCLEGGNLSSGAVHSARLAGNVEVRILESGSGETWKVESRLWSREKGFRYFLMLADIRREYCARGGWKDC